MPLKLVPPEKIKGARCWYIRGTYLGTHVYRSAGTDREQVARAELRRIEREIEDGRFDRRVAQVAPATFAGAAAGYIKECSNEEAQKVKRLVLRFQDAPLSDFTKDTIDAAEAALYPPRKDKKTGAAKPYAAGTLNREFRAPLAAVLHHAAKRGLVGWIRVEKHKEAQRTSWLEPEEAAALIAAARAVDAAKTKNNNARLAPLLVFLFSTGARLGEAIRLTWADVDLARRHVILRDTKNGETYGAHLGDLAFDELANLPGGRHPDRQIFGYTHRRSIRWALAAATKRAGLKKPFTAHLARHSFATWLRRNGEDLKKMMEVGRWKDVKSVMRYQHVASDEQKAAIARLPLPAVKPKKETA